MHSCTSGFACGLRYLCTAGMACSPFMAIKQGQTGITHLLSHCALSRMSWGHLCALTCAATIKLLLAFAHDVEYYSCYCVEQVA